MNFITDRINFNKKYCYKSRCISLIIIFFIIAISTSCAHKANIELIKKDNYRKNDFLTIWAHSDIQPYRNSQRKYYENAIADIDSLYTIDIALVAGDIVNWSKAEDDFEWFLKARSAAPINYWYEIAGNHDQKDYENYKKYINKPLHYSVRIGNILLICMSDESKTAETNISDEAFNWWKDLVIKNQEMIIVTMTHGYLKQSNLLGSIMPSRNIENSERFADVLKKYKVDLWLCGHMHLSHSLNGSVRKADDLNGTLFINVSAIRGGKYNDSESFLLFFKKDSDELIIKSRDHEEKTFNMDDILLKLSKKFQWDNSPPELQNMNYDVSSE